MIVLVDKREGGFERIDCDTIRINCFSNAIQVFDNSVPVKLYAWHQVGSMTIVQE